MIRVNEYNHTVLLFFFTALESNLSDHKVNKMNINPLYSGDDKVFTNKPLSFFELSGFRYDLESW